MMTSTKSWTWALTAAGLLQIGMALAHFGLQYEWRGVDGGSLPAQLRWALFALNFSWSTLVLLIGGLTLYMGRLDPQATLVRWVVVIVTVFWAIHGIYMVVEPMPVPPRLAWIQGPIVAFPATLVLLLGAALTATKRFAAITATVPITLVVLTLAAGAAAQAPLDNPLRQGANMIGGNGEVSSTVLATFEGSDGKLD